MFPSVTSFLWRRGSDCWTTIVPQWWLREPEFKSHRRPSTFVAFLAADALQDVKTFTSCRQERAVASLLFFATDALQSFKSDLIWKKTTGAVTSLSFRGYWRPSGCQNPCDIHERLFLFSSFFSLLTDTWAMRTICDEADCSTAICLKSSLFAKQIKSMFISLFCLWSPPRPYNPRYMQTKHGWVLNAQGKKDKKSPILTFFLQQQAGHRIHRHATPQVHGNPAAGVQTATRSIIRPRGSALAREVLDQALPPR